MLRYEELIQDVKPDIVAGTAACEEVKGSKKFAKILELILLLGNYMNSGSKNGQAFGFEISFLTKVCVRVCVYFIVRSYQWKTIVCILNRSIGLSFSVNEHKGCR